MCHLVIVKFYRFIVSPVHLDGDQDEMDKAVKVVEPIAKEFIEKWKKENKEQVRKYGRVHLSVLESRPLVYAGDYVIVYEDD